jgi:PAS domain S-box-containing protein
VDYTREEIIGRSFLEFLDEESQQLVADRYIRRQRGEDVPPRYEFNIVRKDGEKRRAEISSTVIKDPAGNVQTVGQILDITERKRAEEESRAARQRLLDIIDFLPDATFVIDQDKKVIAWNRAIEEMSGARKEDILGQGDYAYALPFWGERRPIIIDLIGVEDPEFESKYTYVQRQGNTLYAEVYVPSMFGGRGAEVWVMASPLLDSEGNQVGAIESIRDITERKRLERQIQESLARRGTQVQTTTEIAQEIATAPALDEIFRRVVTLIRERFGYYHAQIFRHEPALNAMVLQAGYGKAGEKMLAAGHRLEMGRGVVGTAAATGQSILAPDVAQDEDWRPNPNLPNTKGELAVPIKLRDQVLGILDVQSDRAGALTAEDQLVLEGLCGQIAVVMESTRLLGELRANEAQLSEAQHIAKLAYWEYDVEKDLFLFNDQFYSLFHTTAEQEGGYQISSARYSQKFVHPDDLAVVGTEIERALASTDRHYSRQLDHRILYADGGVGYISVSINIDRDEQGRILRYYGANQDITEIKRAELAIKEEQRRTQTILETVTVPMIISRLSDSKVLYANQALADFRHMDLNELIGSRTVDYFVNPDDRNKLVEILRRQGYANDFETQLRGSGGVVSWVLLSARIINFQNETCVLTSYVDITERKQAEVKTQETLRELERLYRATTREGWQAFLETGQLAPAYRYDRTAVQPAQDVWGPEIEQAIQQNVLVPPSRENAVAAAPLSVRGQVVGALGVYDDLQQPLSSDELVLLQEMIEQGALALENARLYQDSQRLAAREQTINTVTANIRSVPTVDAILQRTVEELARTFGSKRATIRLELESARKE